MTEVCKSISFAADTAKDALRRKSRDENEWEMGAAFYVDSI